MKQAPAKILFLSLIAFLYGCNENDLKIIKSEAWNNLMPGAESKTHIQIILNLPDNDMEFGLSAFLVKWDGNEKLLDKKDYSLEFVKMENRTEAVIKGEFVPGKKDLKTVSVELEAFSGDKSYSASLDSINIENVY